MKITLLILTVFSFFSFLFQACENKRQSPPSSPTHPNIILILSDDQGWGDLSMNGNPNLSTPHIDSMARREVTFDRFYVAPVCSPTRAEILTGRYAVRGGVYSTSEGGERLNLDEKTLAEYFKEAGYATAAYGKWHNGMQYPYHPNARGFDDFYGFCSGHWGNYFSPMLEHNGAIVKGNGFIIDDFTDHALNFIQQNQDSSFFLYLPYNTPHSPMSVPDEWWDQMKDKTLDSLHRDPEKEDLTFTKAALALCENIDWNVGRVLQKLEELSLAENTIVLYLSDNGPNSWRWNGGMKGRKGSTDEGGVRSPLVMQWKGTLPEGKTVPQIASAPDLLPTLADLAGLQIKPPNLLDGRSLKPLLMNENAQWPERMLISHWRENTSVRNQQYRLDSEDQLFDMEADPRQYQNVADQFPQIVDQLKAAKDNFEQNALSELPEEDTRTFPVGHPDFVYTQLPARDAIATGNIQRSNRWPNCSFYTNWTSLNEEITWEVEVLETGDFEATIYYTCAPENVGASVGLFSSSDTLTFQITEPNDPPLEGMEYDRYEQEREESYVKDFKPLLAGVIHLEKGRGEITLKARNIPNNAVMDFRLLMLKRVYHQAQ